MIKQLSIAAVAENLGAPFTGIDAMFSDLSIDSRTLKEGEAFLALRGERFDGHDFVKAAVEAKAGALIVEEPQQIDVPQVIVADSHLALGKIANINRQASKATVIALTGSQGKTTVKEMLHSILSEKGNTLATAANLNNTIGVPLTLLRIGAKHQFAVIEMGANCAGEIEFSAGVTQPDVAMITNASPAHIEGFGSLEGIVEAKGEIFDSLGESGIAILNADDKFADRWIQRASHARAVLFSATGNSEAQYQAHQIETLAGKGVRFNLVSPQGSVDVVLQLLGEHNAANAVAAAAAAMEAGASLQEVQLGLSKLQPVAGRLVQVEGRNGSLIIDDTYNAGPSSSKAAIDVLAQFSGRRIVVAGDMKELGSESESAHAEVGNHAKICGIEELWAIGENRMITASTFGDSAMQFSSQEELIAHGLQQASADVVFLVKGSRGARMENVVAGLRLEGSE